MQVCRSLNVGKCGVGLLYRQFVVNLRLMRNHMPMFLVALTVAGLVSSLLLAGPANAENAPISVMSFNVLVDDGTPSSGANAWVSSTGTSRRDLAIDVVNNFGPDILGVQEALPNQVDDLQNGLPGYGFYGVGRDNGIDEGEFAGIYYRNDRFTQTNQGTFWLSNEPEVPGSIFPGAANIRIASWVTIADEQAGGREIFVLNTHWDQASAEARLFSALLIRDQIASLAGDLPLIVLGDLNEVETSPTYFTLLGVADPDRFLLADTFRRVVPERTSEESTFNGLVGITEGLRIDFILSSDDAFSIEDASIDRTDFNGSYPADHYPVTAILHLNAIPEPSSLTLMALGTVLLASRRHRQDDKKGRVN